MDSYRGDVTHSKLPSPSRDTIEQLVSLLS